MKEILNLITSNYIEHFFKAIKAITVFQLAHFVIILFLCINLYSRLSRSLRATEQEDPKLSKQKDPKLSPFVMAHSFFNNKWNFDSLCNFIFSHYVMTKAEILAMRVEPNVFSRILVGIILTLLRFTVFVLFVMFFFIFSMAYQIFFLAAKFFLLFTLELNDYTHTKLYQSVLKALAHCHTQVGGWSRETFNQTFEEINNMTLESAIRERDLINGEINFFMARIFVLFVVLVCIIWYAFLLVRRIEFQGQEFYQRVFRFLLMPETWVVSVLWYVRVTLLTINDWESRCFSLVNNAALKIKSLTLEEGLSIFFMFLYILVFIVHFFF